MAELKPRVGAYVALVLRVEGPGGQDGEVRLTAVDRAGEPQWGDGLLATLNDGYAIVVGHPLEALGGHPAPERYTEAGVNRPRVFFGFVATPDPDVVLTDDVIQSLADTARATVEKRLKDQAAMEQGARDG